MSGRTLKWRVAAALHRAEVKERDYVVPPPTFARLPEWAQSAYEQRASAALRVVRRERTTEIASLRKLVKELRAGLESALTLPDQTLARATEPDLRKMTATANEQDALLSRLSDLIAKADKATGDE